MSSSTNRLIALGVAAIVILYLLFSSLYVVNVREQAIVLRFGKITAVNTEPGLYFKLPTNFIDTVQIIENRLLRYDIAKQELQVSDGAKYVVDAFLTYRISDPVKFRQRLQGDLALAEQRIDTNFKAVLAQVYGTRKFDAALSAERPQMMLEARDRIAPGMIDLGITIEDVRILRTDLMTDVQESTFNRMSAERFAQAAAIRADGQQAAASIRAIANRQAVETIAAANKDSEILRGEGDAQRAAIYAQAYGADPEFYAFYRSLQSYRTALGASSTTMMLSPDSDFFQYFKAETTNGTVPPPKTPQGIPPLPSSDLSVPDPSDTLPPDNVGAPDTVPLPGASSAAEPALPAESSIEIPATSSEEPVLPSVSTAPEAVPSIQIPAASSAAQ